MRLVVLHDAVGEAGRPDEQDGLIQAQAVATALEEAGHHAVLLPFSSDLEGVRTELLRLAPEIVFNLVESPGGRGRWIHLAPAFLDGLGLPYTGASTEAMLLTSHKVLAKRLLADAGLPTPPWRTEASLAAEPCLPSRRWLVKSLWEDASLGIDDGSLVETDRAPTLRAALAERAGRVAGAVFAEAYVEGREFNLSLLAKGSEPELLPPAEILFVNYPPDKPHIVGYAAKWLPDSFEYAHTPRRFEFCAADRFLLLALERLARRCWSLFGLSGYARVDLRVDASGQPWILEINANPSLSPDAGLLAAAARGNLDLGAVVERIAASVLHRSRTPAS